MAIGAVDYIDKLLVEKYATEQVDNHADEASKVEPEKMMNDINNYALLSRNMVVLNNKLNSACSSLKALNAKYVSLTPIYN